MSKASIRGTRGAGGAALGALVLVLSLALTTPAPAQQTAAAGPPPEASDPSIVVVEMRDFDFSPSRIEVRRGQVVRFVQVSQSPHNVEFRNVPDGTRLGPANPASVSGSNVRIGSGPPPAIGPFLMEKGTSYEIVIGESFATGTHEILCTPHEALGMTGVIVVTGETSSPAP